MQKNKTDQLLYRQGNSAYRTKEPKVEFCKSDIVFYDRDEIEGIFYA